MRIFALLFALCAAPALAAPGTPAPAPASAPAAAQAQPEGTCYFSPSVRGDHLASGCEIPGYRMHYEVAQAWHMFMVLLPQDTPDIAQARHYFALDTLSLNGGTLQQLFDADLAGLQSNRPGTRIVKRLKHALPIEGSGQCLGLSVAYPAAQAHFPFETYYLCEGGSTHYALLLSLSAVSRKEMEAALPAFTRWMDVPQRVRDVSLQVVPRGE